MVAILNLSVHQVIDPPEIYYNSTRSAKKFIVPPLYKEAFPVLQMLQSVVGSGTVWCSHLQYYFLYSLSKKNVLMNIQRIP